MSYKSDFASNNNDLQSILDAVNSLPDKPNKYKVHLYLGIIQDTNSQSSVTINGITYSCPISTDNSLPDFIEVDAGTQITFSVSYSMNNSSNTEINVGGVNVISGGDATYTHTVDTNIIVTMSTMSANGGYYGVIDIGIVDIDDIAFVPTDSGGTTYKSKFADNNIDLQTILELINNLQPAIIIPSFDDILVDFEYTDNGDGTATITGWKGTKDGAASTEIVIPDNNNIKL